MLPQTFQQGETIALVLRNRDGVVVTGLPVAKLRKRSNGVPTGPVVATFTVEARSDLGGGQGAGWVLRASSTGLEPGAYVTDAVLVVGADTFVTEPEAISIQASASAG